jgi:hypothetical protein
MAKLLKLERENDLLDGFFLAKIEKFEDSSFLEGCGGGIKTTFHEASSDIP